MNKSKQKLYGLAMLLLMVAIYSLLPTELQQMIQPKLEAPAAFQTNPEERRLNGRDGISQQLAASSKRATSAKSAQTELTVSNPSNADSTEPTITRNSKEFKQSAPPIGYDSGQQKRMLHETKTGVSKMHAKQQSRGPPGNESEQTQPSNQQQQPADQAETLVYGLLQEISKDQYQSPAGLIYGPGSAEGHRLDHLRRHIQDQPKRPGKHGVFDGGMQGALKTIDNAYQRAQKNQRTTRIVDRNRTIYTVDLGKRIGFVGGQEGGRRRNPMARRVRLVLEGKRVITAYPM